MIRKSILLITAFVIPLFVFPVYSQADDQNISLYEKKIQDSFYNGNDYSLYENIENLITDLPAHPVSTLYYSGLVELSDIYGYGRVNDTLKKAIKKISKKNNSEIKNLLMLKLNLEMEKLYNMYNLNEAKKLSQKFNSIKRWIIIGPYNKYGPGDFEYPFVPEIISDYTGIPPKIICIHKTAHNGIVDLNKFLYPRYGFVYAITTFKTKVPVKIRIYSALNYKIFINGREILKNQINFNHRNLRIIKVWGTEKITLMLKLNNENYKNFRVIITDENNNVLAPGSSLKNIFINDFKYSEEMDYPYNFIKNNITSNKDQGISNRHMACYFEVLNSKESIYFFKQSISTTNDRLSSYLLARSLINHSMGNKTSAKYLEGWRIINRLNLETENFLPTGIDYFKKLFENSNYTEAYKKGINLLKRSPLNLSAHKGFLQLLNYLNYEKETLEHIKLFKKTFPNSIAPFVSEANYYKSRNPERRLEIYKNILRKKFDKTVILKILNIYKLKGKYNSAFEIINKYNHNNEFTDEYIGLLIENKKFEKAKKIIFRNIVKYEKPSLYYKLGLIDYLNNYNHDLYWEKTLSLNPSLFDFSDYVKYLNIKKFENPFKKYFSKSDPVENIMAVFFNKKKKSKTGDIFNKKDPSTILHRERIFLLQKDNSNRIYCRDIIYLNNHKGINKWGEIKIPYTGSFQPIKIRTYYRNGEYNDSYRVRTINGIHYINMNSLRKDSIIHISYIIDNPVTNQGNWKFITHPAKKIQDYDEQVNNLIIKIISPENINLHFNKSNTLTLKKIKTENNNIYLLEAKNLKSIQQEHFTGSSLNTLPYFSFTSMDEYMDFFRWYNGLISGYDNLDSISSIKKLKGGTVKETIFRVYNYISHNIDLMNNVLYIPDMAENTLYKKSGTVEDKVILTRAILKKFGIKSFIAFAKKRYIPVPNRYISPENFTNILLYIPLKIDNGIWLDYSNRYHIFGTVNYDLSDTEGLILLKNNYILKKIKSINDHKNEGIYKITIDNKGNGKLLIVNSFKGLYGKNRKYFANEQYFEDTLNSYYGELLPNFNLENFKISNLKVYNKPLTIKAEGSGIGIALSGSNKLIFKPILNKSVVYSYISKNIRKFPLYISSPIDENEVYTYTLPMQYKRTVILKRLNMNNRFGTVKIEINKERDSNKLNVKKIIKIKKYIIQPSEYNEFVDFCLKINDIENQRILLNR